MSDHNVTGAAAAAMAALELKQSEVDALRERVRELRLGLSGMLNAWRHDEDSAGAVSRADALLAKEDK